jgi:hypothetical protein
VLLDKIAPSTDAVLDQIVAETDFVVTEGGPSLFLSGGDG